MNSPINNNNKRTFEEISDLDPFVFDDLEPVQTSQSESASHSMVVQRRIVVPKKATTSNVPSIRPTGQELAILQSLETNVSAVVQDVTKMDAYTDVINKQKCAPSPFPFPTIDGKPLPALFLAEPSILGAGDSVKALAPFSKKMRTISSRIEIHGQDGNNISSAIVLSDLTQVIPANTLTTGFKKVTDAFKDETITSSEKFVVAFMDGLLTTQKSTGLLLDSKQLMDSVSALADGTGVRIPDKMNEDVRKMVNTLAKKKEDTVTSRTNILREKEERINKARNKATQEIQAIIKNFMNELDDIRHDEIKIATGLLTDELEYRSELEKVIQYANIPSHMIPVKAWLKMRGVVDPNLCFLTGTVIGDGEKKTCLFVSSEPLDGTIRVSLYTPLIRDIIYRAIYGFPLFGERPPTIDLTDYAGVMSADGLRKWTKNSGTISRRPEDQITSQQVASSQDVLLVLRDPKVAPWWKFAQRFSLFRADPTKLPSTNEFKKMMEEFNGQIPDEQFGIILSKFDTLVHKTTNVSIMVPADFEYAYKEFIKNNRTPFINYQKNNPSFWGYFDSLRGLVSEIVKLMNAPSFQMYNPTHV